MATNAGENAAVDAITGQAPSGSRWIALFTADPGETGSMTNELANTNGYGRQSVTFSAASGGEADNDADVEFTASGGDWSEATHWGLVDSGTHGAGDMYETGPIKNSAGTDTPRTVTDGSTLTFAAGDITITGE